MNIAWGSLGIVAVVSFVAATVVVALVSFALVGLAARAPRRDGPPPLLGPTSGTAVGVVCLAGVAAIVAYSLYLIVA